MISIQQTKEITARLFSYILSSIFFGFIPYLLFLVYMREFGFFSYDFFAEGFFGLKVFFFLSLFFILITSLAFFLWLPLLLKFLVSKNYIYLISTILAFVISFYFVYLLNINLDIEKKNYNQLIFISIIGISVSAHVASLILIKPILQLVSLAFFISIIVISTLNFQKEASYILSVGLRAFNVGGEINIALKSKNTANIKIGNLILLSPKHIYLKNRCSTFSITTIDRSSYDLIEIYNKSNSSSIWEEIKKIAWATRDNLNFEMSQRSCNSNKFIEKLLVNQNLQPEYLSEHKTSIIIYTKELENDLNLKEILKNTGLKIRAKDSELEKEATNSLWFGKEVPINQVKLIALYLMRAGIEIKSIRPHRSENKKSHKNIINIGSDAEVKSKKTLIPIKIYEAKVFKR